jgi:pheromone a factor receptor
MTAYPNQLYSAFSFTGFLMCAIPFYWHLEAWNTGTCMYMAWTGLGCLMQCINSIVWNGNMVNRAPVYCDIVTHIQVALNVAIPACSLCINRRLYKVATINAVMVTRSEKRRAIMVDLLIGVGIPILQMIAQYTVSFHRYVIFEDFGPVFSNALVTETFLLFFAWPVAIGCVSLVYCVLTIYTLCKRERQFSEMMSSNRNLNRGRYIRLMALSAIEILGTIPIGTYFIVYNAKKPVTSWKSWSQTHDGHLYSHIFQVPASVWRNTPDESNGLEMFRWLLVACAFVFFAFFGFADEARRHYRLVYKSLISRITSTSTVTLRGSSHATSSAPYMKSKGGVSVSVVTASGDKRDSMVSFTDQLSIPSISFSSDLKPDFKIEQYSPSDSIASSSVTSFEPGTLSSLHQPVVTLPVAPPASVPPHLPDPTKMTIRGYSSEAANAV